MGDLPAACYRYYPLAIMFIAFAVITHSVVTTWQVLHAHQFESLPVTLSPSTPKSFNLSEAARLFGEDTTVDEPLSDLQWQLIAVFVNSDPKRSRAIIDNGSGATSYQIGDAIESNIKLHEIKADRVVIKRNAQLESILIDPNQLEMSPPNQSSGLFEEDSQ